jgi:hypothetical protein
MLLGHYRMADPQPFDVLHQIPDPTRMNLVGDQQPIRLFNNIGGWPTWSKWSWVTKTSVAPFTSLIPKEEIGLSNHGSM